MTVNLTAATRSEVHIIPDYRWCLYIFLSVARVTSSIVRVLCWGDSWLGEPFAAKSWFCGDSFVDSVDDPLQILGRILLGPYDVRYLLQSFSGINPRDPCGIFLVPPRMSSRTFPGISSRASPSNFSTFFFFMFSRFSLRNHSAEFFRNFFGFLRAILTGFLQEFSP